MLDLAFDQEWPEVGTLAFEAAKEWGVSLCFTRWTFFGLC
jgi:hypothetical protein